MRTGTVGALAALGCVAVAGGWYFGTRTAPSEQTAGSGGMLMFPDLTPKLRDAARVEITHQGKQTVIEKRGDGGWGVASMRGYPVQEAKLRGLLTGLTELRLVEQRTSDPAELGRLGLDDPNGAASGADLLRVVDAGGKPILGVIVGHRRVRSQANVPEEVYVRRPDDNQSWLAEGSLHADADAAQWLDRNIMNIAHDRVVSVTVDQASRDQGSERQVPGRMIAGDTAGSAKALVFGRLDGGKFAVTEPAEHPRLEDYKVEDVARALELLTFQAVKADADAAGVEAGHSVFTLKDGLAVRVTVLHAEKDVWARFAVSASSDAAKAEADRLAGRVAGWTYQIGSWKEQTLVPTMGSLKAEDSVKAGGPGAAGRLGAADGAGAADGFVAGDDSKAGALKPAVPPAGDPPGANSK